MVKKNKVLPKDKIDQIKGFEEIMDLVLDEQEQIQAEQKKKELEKYNDTYQLYNFLENEVIRLEKFSQFFGTKLKNYKKFNQTQYIAKKQTIICDEAKEKLVKRMLPSDSHLNKQLESLFNSLF
ncbi:hypothetical protein [Halobacteriovorax sp. HLS]|uniref:hypothetical protein n=1 Tax=Halobacteriovorax sp. HLS TaxID=2234000 RepID=UPI000FD8C9AC|nr:hypothetical protein [Halobacteriovorax sp. HLS]